MINEFDMIVPTADLPEHSLHAGDMGTVVLIHNHGGYEVEFAMQDGETSVVVSVAPDQLRAAG
jgi:hypothetical protein